MWMCLFIILSLNKNQDIIAYALTSSPQTITIKKPGTTKNIPSHTRKKHILHPNSFASS